MICPSCSAEAFVDHVVHRYDDEGRLISTQYFYVCRNSGNGTRSPCPDYGKTKSLQGEEAPTEVVLEEPVFQDPAKIAVPEADRREMDGRVW